MSAVSGYFGLHSGGNAFGMRGGASYAVISEAVGGHQFGIIEVAPVDDDGVFEFLVEAGEVEGGELFPLGENQERIRAMRSFVG